MKEKVGSKKKKKKAGNEKKKLECENFFFSGKKKWYC